MYIFINIMKDPALSLSCTLKDCGTETSPALQRKGQLLSYTAMFIFYR